MDSGLAAHLLGCLTDFLKGIVFWALLCSILTAISLDYAAAIGSQSLVVDPLSLFTKLHDLIREGLAADSKPNNDVVVSAGFAALLRLSLASEAFGTIFKASDSCFALMKRLLLEEPNWQVRRRVSDHIKMICNELHRFVPLFSLIASSF